MSRYCQVCGYESAAPPWGEGGRCPSFDLCPCCGVEWGYQDATAQGIQRFRKVWLATGGAWADSRVAPDGLGLLDRLRRVL